MVKKHKLCLIAILFASLLISVVLFVGNKQTIKIIHAEELNPSYAYGSSFIVPKMTVEVDGKQIEASSALRYPDGKTFVKDKYALNVAGQYYVVYTVESNGKVIDVSEKSFKVYQNLISISDYDSNAVYESDSENLAFPDLGAGLKASIYSGGWISFNQPVDLNKVGDKSPISMYVVPKKEGVADFKRLIVRFTDTENPDNYVDFYSNYGTNDVTYTSMQAGSAEQDKTGRVRWWYPTENRWIDYLSVGGLGGQPADFSFIGRHTTDAYRLYDLRLKLDTNEVYMQGKKIIDLDDPLDFETLWHGFTNNKVYISVGAELVSNVSADLVITDVFGIDLNKSVYDDNEGPEMNVDLMGYEENNLPHAVKGYSYVVFDAKSDRTTNSDGIITKVYYNYSDEASRHNVEIVDGRFKTEKTGIYTIEYTAMDSLCNATVKRINVCCTNKTEPLVLNLENCEVAENGNVGEEISICRDFGASGGSGLLTTKIEVVQPDGKRTEVTDGFMPTQKGEHSIVYSVTDMAGQTFEKSFPLNVDYSKNYIFNTTPQTEEYYLSGKKYTLAPYMGYLYAENGKITESVAAAAYKIDGGQEISIPASGEFTPIAEAAEGTISFVYRLSGAEKTVSKKIFKFTTAGKISLPNYFDKFGGAEVKVSSTDAEAVLLSKNTAGTGGAIFVNPLLAEGFSSDLKILDNCFGFKTLTLTLTDKNNPAQSVSVIVSNENGNAYVTIDGKRFSLTQSFTSGADKEISAVFSNGYFAVNNEAKAKITKYDDGREYKGFDSGFVYLKLTFADVNGEASLRILRLNGQNFDATITEDEQKPSFYLSADNSGAIDVGSIFTISKAYGGDVLDHTVKFLMTVTNSDNEVMVSEDGITLKNVDPTRDYNIRLAKSGKYKITYTVEDTSENKLTQSIIVTAKSFVEPTIEFSGNYEQTAKVGKTVNIAKAAAKDENGKAVSVYVHVIDADGTFNYLGISGASFEAKKAGTYRVCYIAQDEIGNMAYRQYTVTVEE